MNDVERKKYLEDIKNNLTINQIYDFLVDAGGEPQIHGDIIISRTICHNPPGLGSFKLYYYDNTKLFKCFTQCSDTFDIFDLALKIKRLAGEQIIYWSKDAIQTSRPWDLPDAVRYIAIYYGLEAPNENFSENRIELQDWQIFSKLEAKKLQKNRNQIVSLKVFKDDFLKNMPQPKIIPWIKEGITPEIMKIHNIYYDPKNQGIIIPHYDIDNNLIGVRERTLIKENEIYGKYRPAILNGKMYNHPLSFNLYNINHSKKAISIYKKAIVFEGEKSCLKYASYFGIENDISVATCGQTLLNFQLQLLYNCGAKEIIIAWDREGENDNKEQYIQKFYNLYNKYKNMYLLSFIYDKNGQYLDYKMSPIDAGKDVFLQLYKERIIL